MCGNWPKMVDDSRIQWRWETFAAACFCFSLEQEDPMTTTVRILLLLLMHLVFVRVFFSSHILTYAFTLERAMRCNTMRCHKIAISTKIDEKRFPEPRPYCHHLFPPAKSCHQLNFKRLFLHVRKSRQNICHAAPCHATPCRTSRARCQQIPRFPYPDFCRYFVRFSYHLRVLTIRFDYAFKSNCCRRGRIRQENPNMKRLRIC